MISGVMIVPHQSRCSACCDGVKSFFAVFLALHSSRVSHRVNQLYQGVQIGLPYTLAVFIVRHFEATRSEAQIGQLTGILVRCTPKES